MKDASPCKLWIPREGGYGGRTVSFKQAVRWENGTVWRKRAEFPKAPNVHTGETSLVVMSSQNLSIKKQFENWN